MRRCDRAFSLYELARATDPGDRMSYTLTKAFNVLQDECPERQVNRTGLVTRYIETVGPDGHPWRVPVPTPIRARADSIADSTLSYGTVNTASPQPSPTPAYANQFKQQVSTKPKPEVKARTVMRRLILPTDAHPV